VGGGGGGFAAKFISEEKDGTDIIPRVYERRNRLHKVYSVMRFTKGSILTKNLDARKTL
jgi:hypothetical protein